MTVAVAGATGELGGRVARPSSVGARPAFAVSDTARRLTGHEPKTLAELLS